MYHSSNYNVRTVFNNALYNSNSCIGFFLYRKNLFMKEKLNKKEQHKLYTLFTIYRSNIVGKTNQFKHNSLFINLFCLQYYLSQWSWPKIDTLLLRI